MQLNDITILSASISGSGSLRDEDWLITDGNNSLLNDSGRDVIISNAFLSIDIRNQNTSSFVLQKQGETKLQVNPDGIMVISESSTFPTPQKGNVIYKDDDFYLAL
jgi:hypothetical protein